jgi:hypothetical protein
VKDWVKDNQPLLRLDLLLFLTWVLCLNSEYLLHFDKGFLLFILNVLDIPSFPNFTVI